jgi:hypothetical protein
VRLVAPSCHTFLQIATVSYVCAVRLQLGGALLAYCTVASSTSLGAVTM